MVVSSVQEFFPSKPIVVFDSPFDFLVSHVLGNSVFGKNVVHRRIPTLSKQSSVFLFSDPTDPTHIVGNVVSHVIQVGHLIYLLWRFFSFPPQTDPARHGLHFLYRGSVNHPSCPFLDRLGRGIAFGVRWDWKDLIH